MLKKFIEGLVFGTGFFVAVAILCVASGTLILPKIFDTGRAQAPYLHIPAQDTAVQSTPQTTAQPQQYRFFKDSGSAMQIPLQGGILAMATTSTPVGADRPSTTQMWLTETALWQIKTVGDKAEATALKRPANASANMLHQLFRQHQGMSANSMMTVSADAINEIKASGSTAASERLNGKLGVTADGVVFLVPNQYQR